VTPIPKKPHIDSRLFDGIPGEHEIKKQVVHLLNLLDFAQKTIYNQIVIALKEMGQD